MGRPLARATALAAVLALGFALACERDAEERAPDASPAVAPGTRRMAARLADLASRTDPRTNLFANGARARRFESELERARAASVDPPSEIELRIRLGLELARAGRSDDAIRALAPVEDLVSRLEDDVERSVHRWLFHRTSALAFLRLAEDENCVRRPGCDACLFPVRAAGIHKEERGARGAFAHLLAALEEKPGDLGAIWLLNVAAMTLGEHPDSVPKRFRMAAAAFSGDGEAPRFTDIAESAGVAAFGLSGGAAMDDFDGDGDLDIICSSWGPSDPIRFFRNRGDATFEERTEAAGLAGLTGGLNLVHADYDGDGDLDVLVLRGAWLGEDGRLPNSLLENRGDGTFEDVTESAGLLSFHPTQTAAWADYDLDGDLDLFIGNESDERGRHPCELYVNQGDGSFVESAHEAGVDHVGFVKGVVWGDVDDDGRPDLYLSTLDEPNVLFRNRGAGPDGVVRFEDVTARAGVAEPRRSFPTWFFDYDNDGRLDLYVASYEWERTIDLLAADRAGIAHPGEHPRLYRNLGNGRFEDVTRAVGLDRFVVAMGANFGDIDGDGFLDLYLGTGEPSLSSLMPNVLYRNLGGERFVDATAAAGLGHLQKGHAVAFGDVDGDGDEDLYTVLGGAYEGDRFRNALFLNPGPAHRWVVLRLRARGKNPFAVGARVTLHAEGPSGRRTIVRDVTTGGSFGSSSFDLEIGLGDASAIDSVRVRWPRGMIATYSAIPVDRRVELREGEEAPRVLEARSLRTSRWGSEGRENREVEE